MILGRLITSKFPVVYRLYRRPLFLFVPVLSEFLLALMRRNLLAFALSSAGHCFLLTKNRAK